MKNKIVVSLTLLALLLVVMIVLILKRSEIGGALTSEFASFSVDGETAPVEESEKPLTIAGPSLENIKMWENCFLLPEGWNPTFRGRYEDDKLVFRFGGEAIALFAEDTNQLIYFSSEMESGFVDITGVPRSLIEEVLLDVTEKVARNMGLKPEEYEAHLNERLKANLDSGEASVRLTSEIRMYPNGYYFPAGEVNIVVNLDARKAESIDIVNQLVPEKPVINMTEADAMSTISGVSNLIEGTLSTPEKFGIHHYRNPMYLKTVGTQGRNGIEFWDCRCVRVRLCYLFFTEDTALNSVRVLIDAETGMILQEEW